MRIDTHNHWMPPAYVEAIREHAASDTSFARAAALMLMADEGGALRRLDRRLGEMDEAGINVSVNDDLVAGVEKEPRRFCALAAVPLPHVAAALAELDRVAEHPQVRGIGLMTHSNGWTLDDPSFEPFYARAAQLGLPVVLHPQLEDPPPPYRDWALAASLAPMVNSSLGVLRLILSGLLDRVPGLEVIVPHLGGTIPFLIQRLLDLSGKGGAEHDLLHYCRNRLYFDTCSYHPPALRCAAETVGAGRLVLGSDYPFRGGLGRCVDDVERSGFSPADQEAILGGTATRWFAPGREGVGVSL